MSDNQDKIVDIINTVNTATMASASLALRTLVLINGGAAVAILAFAGNILAKGNHDASKLALPLKVFGFGVAIATLAMVFAYLTNLAHVAIEIKPYNQQPVTRWHLWGYRTLLVLALLLALSALGLFVDGIYASQEAIVTFAG